MDDFARHAATALLLVAPVIPAGATPTARPVGVEIPQGSTRCAVNAWTSFRASAPIPVRAGPSTAARVVGQLPVSATVDDDLHSIEFDVVEARPGWLKIAHASDPVASGEDGQPLPPRAVYQGVGWIPADAAQVGIQSALGYARPDADSPLLLDLDDDWLTDIAELEAIRGCSGPWLLLDYQLAFERGPRGSIIEIPADKRRKGTAWFRGICENQYTTCDMRSVDQRK